jgi:hypothetical protein
VAALGKEGRLGGLGSPQSSSRAAETRAINSSLHVLTRVVAAYAGAVPGKRPPHVPFRESLLTLLLKDSIGGNSRTAFVVTMSGEDVVQSYRTAQFARLARGVRNSVKENRVTDPTAIIAALRARVQSSASRRTALPFRMQSITSGRNPATSIY